MLRKASYVALITASILATQFSDASIIRSTPCLHHDGQPCLELAPLDPTYHIGSVAVHLSQQGATIQFNQQQFVSITDQQAKAFGTLTLNQPAITIRSDQDLLHDLTTQAPSMPNIDPHIVLTVKLASHGCSAAHPISQSQIFSRNQTQYVICESYADE